MKKLILLASLLFVASTTFAATLTELLPQPGVTLLGISCGGVHTSTYVTGFDDSGNITGEVYAWTRCGGSGRGGGYTSKTYKSWHSIVWNLDGVALYTTTYDGEVPDLTFTETDVDGNTIYTVSKLTSFGVAYVGVVSRP